MIKYFAGLSHSGTFSNKLLSSTFYVTPHNTIFDQNAVKTSVVFIVEINRIDKNRYQNANAEFLHKPTPLRKLEHKFICFTL